jgi:hypothetical protein
LPDIGAVEVALVDGDHNHYTVSRELALLAATARAAGKPTPVILGHDVCWPYGRRDLYCDPETIPAEFRHPWRRAGMLPGQSDLAEAGGLNPDMCNATHEGGAGNGVLTAIEDFLGATDEDIELTVLPVIHGLAVLVPRTRAERHPGLDAIVGRWRTVERLTELAALAETARCRAEIVVQAEPQSADRRTGGRPPAVARPSPAPARQAGVGLEQPLALPVPGQLPGGEA